MGNSEGRTSCRPTFGVGLTYCRPLAPFLAARADLIDVVEVSPETLFLPDGHGAYLSDETEFVRLMEFPAPKVIHGIGNPIGGSAPLDLPRLDLLASVVRRFSTDLVSEHLSFARVMRQEGCEFAGFLLPPRQTDEGVNVAARSARSMAEHVNVQFAIENGVNYLQPRADEMADGEFVAAVAEAADVDILLDLHNAYTNERNGRQLLSAFVDALPLERVVEIHVAGGQPHDGYWLDAHCGAMPDAVFAFAKELVSSLPNLRLINFELFPEFVGAFGVDGLARELERCHELWSARHGTPLRRPRHRHSPIRVARAPSPSTWECELASLIAEPRSIQLPPDREGGLAHEARHGSQGQLDDLKNDPGIALLNFLVSEFRAGMLARALKLVTRLLLLYLGESTVRRIYADFFTTRPPEFFAALEAKAFARYLAGLYLDVPHLDAVVAFELALLSASMQGVQTAIEFAGEPEQILTSLARGVRPPPPVPHVQRIVVKAD